MPRQTVADRKAERQAAEQERARKRAEFLAELPKRILLLMAKATNTRGANASLSSTAEQPVQVEFSFQHKDYRHERALHLASEEWEVEEVEQEFERLAEEERERERVRLIAQAGYDKLSEEERKALGVRKPL